MTEKRPRYVTVFNTTGRAHVINSDGSFIFPGDERQADPNDPFVKALLAKGDIILKEG
jgi:hypothetical protein